MGKLAALAAAVGAACTMLSGAAQVNAEPGPPPPGCERVPMLGLNPQIRQICDLPMQEDGSWERWRWFWAPQYVSSICGGVYEGWDDCPQWSKVSTPAWESPVEKYIVTPGTVPPGEPGYIGG